MYICSGLADGQYCGRGVVAAVDTAGVQAPSAPAAESRQCRGGAQRRNQSINHVDVLLVDVDDRFSVVISPPHQPAMCLRSVHGQPLRSYGMSFNNVNNSNGDSRETSFLFQRLSMLIQRFNPALITDSFCFSDEDPDL